MEPKFEVGLEATRQRLETDGAAETQLEGARQELEAAETQLEETRQELAATRGAKLSAEIQLEVAVRALKSSIDLLCFEKSTKASTEEKDADIRTVFEASLNAMK